MLSQDELTEFGIEVATAGEGLIEVYESLPGEVQPNDDRLAHIVPRYSGIVIDVLARIGDRVKRGDVLAVIESDNSLAPYELKTLIDGTVIAKHITHGEAVSRDKDTYLIADLSSVWVDLTVYQRDLDRIQIGQEAFIFTGHGPAEATGSISYITPVMDERTRTATARIILPNPRGEWRPGMFITAKVLIEKRQAAVAVPHTAIHTIDERPVVFVETDAGFHPQEVVLGQEGIQMIEITAGLEAGTRYVAVGGFTLKAELGKSAFGDGHGH
jgi:cobalt-zinc-cadmium efflux system membrane fusion protein